MKCFLKRNSIISIALLLIINVLFFIKYSYRISEYLPFFSIFYILIIVFLYNKIICNKLNISQVFKITVLLIFIVVIFVILYLLPKKSLSVDRWMMIDVFWNSVEKGIYPYSVAGSNGNYPGPLPVYFILLYPFYLIGEIGIGSIFIIFVYIYYIRKNNNINSFNVFYWLFFSSIAIYWEILTRSTIFFNAVIFFIYFKFLQTNWNKSNKMFLLTAILGGMMLSTRNVFAIPVLLWSIYIMKNKMCSVRKMVRWYFILSITFAATFLPFILMSPELFLKYNPFITQTEFILPVGYILFFIILSVTAGFFIKSDDRVIFYTSIILFCIVTCHCIYGCLINGSIDLFLTNGCDISYYIFCFPFLMDTILMSLKSNKNKVIYDK